METKKEQWEIKLAVRNFFWSVYLFRLPAYKIEFINMKIFASWLIMITESVCAAAEGGKKVHSNRIK
jgi:hypothetical protein